MIRGGGFFLGALSLFALSGCVTLADSTFDRPIDREVVESLAVGETSVSEALAALGAPLEYHAHTDGLLVVYRYAERRNFQMQLGASQALRFIDATQVAAEILGNISFTYERIYSDQDRLVLLFDDDRTLQGVGVKWATE